MWDNVCIFFVYVIIIIIIVYKSEPSPVGTK